jgi:predicted GNAT superfamily acetyltransferase
MPPYDIRFLETIAEMHAIEKLTDEIWHGGDADIVPAHMLITFAHNGGLILGAYENEKMVGFAFGFPGLYPTPNGLKIKHTSHQMGVHPAHRGKKLGYALKKAQWQMARRQGLNLMTWTYDPLLSRNAYLNIARLGAVCNTYRRNEYGTMTDGLNAGVASDRFQVDWWLNTERVKRHLDERTYQPLGLENYQKAEAQSLYLPETNVDADLLKPPSNYAAPSSPLLLLQIPSAYQSLRKKDLALAKDWRFFTRSLFEDLFARGYIVTDFIYDRSEASPRSFYLLTDGESTIA